MRRASQIQREKNEITTVQDLTGVFESIASTQIAKIKDKTQVAEEFFQLLWKKYSAIRLDPGSRITSRQHKAGERTVFVVISAESGLSGDIDQRLMETMLKDYNSANTDIVVLGTHGATQLQDEGIPLKHFFKVPESDSYIDVGPVVQVIQDYPKITVFYEVYFSLGVQEIKKMDLITELHTMSQKADENEDIITEKETIFEPSLDDIADIMEQGMMSMALSQAIMESGLAQAASRFNAMAAAKKRAFEMIAFYNLEFHRSKRGESDRRLREVLTAIKKKKKKMAAKKR
jgi:ATP synthase F1 gamma subunit